jgi:hypothetical protein
VLFGMPSTGWMRLDLPIASEACFTMLPWIPAVQLGASYGGGMMTLRNFQLQPRRLQFEIDGAPAELPLSLQIASPQPFLFGWLQVPDLVQTSIATSAQRMRLVGTTYWAVPVGAAQTANVSRAASVGAAQTANVSRAASVGAAQTTNVSRAASVGAAQTANVSEAVPVGAAQTANVSEAVPVGAGQTANEPEAVPLATSATSASPSRGRRQDASPVIANSGNQKT